MNAFALAERRTINQEINAGLCSIDGLVPDDLAMLQVGQAALD